MYLLFLAIGFISFILVRFQPIKMGWVLLSMDLAQIIILKIAIHLELASIKLIPPNDAFILTSFFSILWIISAVLFRKSG